MTFDESTCPQCGSPLTLSTDVCPACGARLGPVFSPSDSADLDFEPDTDLDQSLWPGDAPAKLRNPNRPALLSVGTMVGLLVGPVLLLLALVSRGYGELALLIPTIILTGLLVLFVIAWVVAWLAGLRQLGRIRAFLASNRPLLRWDYTPEEWREIREANWQEERGDWRIQFGCLAFLLGLVGLLVGAMVGFDEGLEEAMIYGLAGGGGGLLFGGLLGGVVAAGNHLAVRSAYHQAEPGIVALAPHEIYANDQYFRGNGQTTYLKRASLLPAEPNVPPRLLLELKVPPRPRTSSDQEWEVMVPPRLVQAVEAVLPRLNGPRPARNRR